MTQVDVLKAEIAEAARLEGVALARKSDKLFFIYRCHRNAREAQLALILGGAQ